MNVHEYDLIIINSSAGKDSLASIYEVCRLADEQGYPKERIKVSHQDLGRMEWPGTKELAAKQAEHFGLEIYYSKRRDKNGYKEDLLEYAERRGAWPSNKQRWCTSDFKRGPGARVVTALTKPLSKGANVLYVFGFRWEESPARAKKKLLTINKRLTNKSRTVYDWCPILHWSTKKVWKEIKGNDLPYHPAYDLGMPRLSCCFCIFSPFDALVIAGIMNPELLDDYCQVEEKISHDFKMGAPIRKVKEAIEAGYEPAEKINDWVM